MFVAFVNPEGRIFKISEDSYLEFSDGGWGLPKTSVFLGDVFDDDSVMLTEEDVLKLEKSGSLS